MKIEYVTKRFSAESQSIIERANDIIAEYDENGFSLTLRQLYYQFVAHDWFPDDWLYVLINGKWVLDLVNGSKNAEPNYKKLGKLVNNGRLAGLIDWNAIEDRTRYLRKVQVWQSPKPFLNAVKNSYHFDLWKDQMYRPEVWIEKDALVGCIEDVCDKLQVPYLACRGYTSQSEQWASAQRIKRHIDNGKIPIILYLGDHDPSGIDMTRDHCDRLTMFDAQVEVRRLALNYDQVLEYNPPPNPTKSTDSRSTGYEKEFGDECWELDALTPNQIADLVSDAIDEYTDSDLMYYSLKEQARHVEAIREAIDRINA